MIRVKMRVLRNIPQITFGSTKIGPLKKDSVVELPLEVAEKLEELKWAERIDDLAMVIFMDDVKEFVGVDGRIYGPFKKGDIANLPKENVDALAEHEVVQVVSS
jgi:hypothetical protein